MPLVDDIVPALFNIATSADAAPEFYGDVPLPSPRALPVQAVAPPGVDCPAPIGLIREGATSEIASSKLADIPTLSDIGRGNFAFIAGDVPGLGEPPPLYYGGSKCKE